MKECANCEMEFNEEDITESLDGATRCGKCEEAFMDGVNFQKIKDGEQNGQM